MIHLVNVINQMIVSLDITSVDSDSLLIAVGIIALIIGRKLPRYIPLISFINYSCYLFIKLSELDNYLQEIYPNKIEEADFNTYIFLCGFVAAIIFCLQIL